MYHCEYLEDSDKLREWLIKEYYQSVKDDSYYSDSFRQNVENRTIDVEFTGYKFIGTTYYKSVNTYETKKELRDYTTTKDVFDHYDESENTIYLRKEKEYHTETVNVSVPVYLNASEYKNVIEEKEAICNSNNKKYSFWLKNKKEGNIESLAKNDDHFDELLQKIKKLKPNNHNDKKIHKDDYPDGMTSEGEYKVFPVYTIRVGKEEIKHTLLWWRTYKTKGYQIGEDSFYCGDYNPKVKATTLFFRSMQIVSFLAFVIATVFGVLSICNKFPNTDVYHACLAFTMLLFGSYIKGRVFDEFCEKDKYKNIFEEVKAKLPFYLVRIGVRYLAIFIPIILVFYNVISF